MLSPDATRVQVLWSLADLKCQSMNSPSRWASRAVDYPGTWQEATVARPVRTRRDGTDLFTTENEHVRQLVIDAVFNAEHAGPGIPPPPPCCRRTAVGRKASAARMSGKPVTVSNHAPVAAGQGQTLGQCVGLSRSSGEAAGCARASVLAAHRRGYGRWRGPSGCLRNRNGTQGRRAGRCRQSGVQCSSRRNHR